MGALAAGMRLGAVKVGWYTESGLKERPSGMPHMGGFAWFLASLAW